MKPVDLNVPEPGFYAIRMVRRGPFVPVRIFFVLEIDGKLFPWVEDDGTEERNDRSVMGPTRIAARNGEIVPMEWVWPYCARYPITEAEYIAMLDRAEAAPGAPPQSSPASPHEPVDYGTLAIPDF